MSLCFMYTTGKGTLEDLVKAHMWANISIANGNGKGSEFREILATGMTPSQIEKAQDLMNYQLSTDVS